MVVSTARAIVVPAIESKLWDSTIIFSHGLGDTGAGWSFLAETWQGRKLFPRTAFIFPHAPTIPITCNGGMRMPGWYDIVDFGNLTAKEDENGLKSSARILQGIITEQVELGIPSKRIILGGFSQGGVMSLLTGLTSEMSLGGIVALSSYLPMRDQVSLMITDANRKTPIFMGHGKEDPVVKHAWGIMSRDLLLKQKCDVTWHEYDGLGHSVDPEEINTLERWIASRLAPEKGPAGSSKSEL
ncbi:hypothetical protein TWF106_000704 [Orbilia oligospora]|uniref:Acyl-protein thioesterase 1 n=1 Tax=Orbilia oligospora TaxID=2813651 RepID=A0A6G1LWT1_ORBOL|nr:hypothetical protein TWF679_009266 [Orbilia oligospora]KAF3206504.1 hypothetical protein TWF106_000704 [Orbilia oligospora]KAF3236037.1 hypothetical protein TWF192_000552 [Orbilia oligospora]